MSTKNVLDKGAFLLLATLVTLFLIAFAKEPQYTVFLFLSFALGALFIFNQFLGLGIFLFTRPVLDHFSNTPLLEIAQFQLNPASATSLAIIAAFLTFLLGNFEKFKKVPLAKQWTLFIFVALISLLFSISLPASISEILRITTIFAIFCFAYLATANHSTKTVIKTIILSSIIPIAFAFYQFFTKTGFSLSFEDIPNRVFGTFAHPNPFAYFTALALSLCLIFALKKENKQRFFALLLSILALVAIGLTYTRGSWLLIAGVVFIVGIMKFRKLLIVAIFAFFVAYALVSPFHTRIDSLFNQGPSSSIAWRISLWSDSLEYIKESPILGHGVGTAEQLILEKRGDSFGSTIPHNDFLRMTLDIGIAGLLTYIYLLISSIRLLVNKHRSETRIFEKTTLLFLSAFGIMLIFSSFIDNIFEASTLQIAFWASIGAVLAKEKK